MYEQEVASRLIWRTDDMPEVLERRLQLYADKTRPLLGTHQASFLCWYTQPYLCYHLCLMLSSVSSLCCVDLYEGQVHRVDTTRNELEVFADITKVPTQHMTHNTSTHDSGLERM